MMSINENTVFIIIMTILGICTILRVSYEMYLLIRNYRRKKRDSTIPTPAHTITTTTHIGNPPHVDSIEVNGEIYRVDSTVGYRGGNGQLSTIIITSFGEDNVHFYYPEHGAQAPFVIRRGAFHYGFEVEVFYHINEKESIVPIKRVLTHTMTK